MVSSEDSLCSGIAGIPEQSSAVTLFKHVVDSPSVSHVAEYGILKSLRLLELEIHSSFRGPGWWGRKFNLSRKKENIRSYCLGIIWEWAPPEEVVIHFRPTVWGSQPMPIGALPPKESSPCTCSPTGWKGKGGNPALSPGLGWHYPLWFSAALTSGSSGASLKHRALFLVPGCHCWCAAVAKNQ